MDETKLSDLAESLIDFCNALESLAVNLKRQLKPLTETELRARISEKNFNILKWSNEKGAKLGDYQVAYRSHNLPEKWSHVFHVLKANNSLIANPFHEEDYKFRYWIYPEKYEDRIFRKELNEKEAKE